MAVAYSVLGGRLLGARNLQGLERQLPIQFRSHQAGRRIPGGMRAASGASTPRLDAASPAAGRQGSGTAPVTHRLPQATGNVRLFPIVIATRAQAGGSNPGPDVRYIHILRPGSPRRYAPRDDDRFGRTAPTHTTVTPDLIRGPASSSSYPPPKGSWIPAFAGMTATWTTRAHTNNSA